MKGKCYSIPLETVNTNVGVFAFFGATSFSIFLRGAMTRCEKI